ncbi:MAG: hypothetical protein ACJ8F1_16865 [Polyangia bacterium]
MDATVTVGTDATAYPTTPPPDPIPEYPPPSPGWGYTWIAGYWDWGGYDWNWEPGYWAPQEAGYAYVGPRFVFVDGRPVYYRAYWRGPGGRVVYGYGPRGAPPVGYRARPAMAPHAWRAEPAHNSGWHSHPGAGSFRAAPAGGGGSFRAQPAAPAGGGFRAQPAAPGGGGFHSAPPAGGGGFRAAPAAPAGRPMNGGGGGGFHAPPAHGGGGGGHHK